MLQSAAPDRPDWVQGCLDSVQRWAAQAGYEYGFAQDEIFDRLPSWYRNKLAARTPILADLARLLWIQQAHTEGGEWVLWLDADTLVIDNRWRPSPSEHTVLGEECWVQRDSRGRFVARYQPHNAFLLIHRDSPVLAFLIYAVESIIARADPAHIAPQMVGPKLLKALHSLVAFELEPAAGALSPELIAALAGDLDLRAALNRWPADRPLAMANLCASLSMEPGVREQLIADPSQVSQGLQDAADLVI